MVINARRSPSEINSVTFPLHAPLMSDAKARSSLLVGILQPECGGT
jgi:hypothetical protein